MQYEELVAEVGVKKTFLLTKETEMKQEFKATNSPHHALGIANWFIENGDLYTPLQIIKLVYMSHGWMLGLYDRPLIKENVEAWKYGPVVPVVYHAIKGFGSLPVEEIKMNVPPIVLVLDEYESDLIKQVNQKYGCFTGIRLSQLTHARGSPWDEIWDGTPNKIIPNELIQKYYKALAVKASNRNV